MSAAAIVLNNYFHDVATALLFTTAVVAWVLERRVAEDASALAALRAAYPALSRFAVFALLWIVVGGIPRTIFFPRYEFIPAVDKGLVALLVVKHVVMFAAVVFGGVMWLRIRKRAQAELGR